jgi:putative two-component system response regulator
MSRAHTTMKVFGDRPVAAPVGAGDTTDDQRPTMAALRLYARACEAATAGITVSDCRRPDLPLVYANPAFLRLTGYALGEVVGRNCRFLQGPDTAQPGLVTLRAALRAGRDCAVLLKNYRRDGAPFWNELTMAPARDDDGRLTHYIGIQTEVTARVAAEAALHRANAELERRVLARTTALTAANAALAAAQYETLDRLARAAEARDDDTGRHTARVGATSALLARELGWPGAEAERLGRAAVLHDVGKIGLPDGVLLKPGRLDAAELAVMRAHTTAGAAILAGSDQAVLRLAEAVALTHHERWDGAGYPRGLAGDAIPRAGRIVAVADVFDALTHARPYKAAWPVAAAVAELTRQAGRQFDPAVVAAFLALHARRHRAGAS